MNKVILEFDDFAAAINWAKRVADDPHGEVFGAKVLPDEDEDKPVKKAAAEKTIKAVEKVKEETKVEVTDLLAEVKEAGVELAEMSPSRYEGVQVLLASKGYTKIKDLDEEEQAEALKMFKQMKEASAEKFGKMVAFLKKNTKKA
jgi:hypothetical protein